MYDVAEIRKDFPILERQVHGVPLVYLDNAATSQKPRAVIQALSDYYERYNANVHRGAHTLAIEATDAYEEARAKVARFINAPGPENIVFVRNTTEAINLVAHTWGVANVKAGDRIVVTEMEHHSNLVPWQHVARVNGAELKLIAMAKDYTLDTSDLDELLTPATRLVAITQMSNVLGTITPVADITAAAHRVGALVLIDAAQSVPHMPVDVQALDCDFMAFSGHKMLGPTGIGVLYIRSEVSEQMDPFLRGGEMVLEVTYEDASWNEVPLKFEAGTPNIGDAIALGAAIDYLTALGMDNVREHEVALTRYAMERFAELEEVTTFGPSDLSVRGGVVSFYMSEIHPHDIGQVLDQLGVAIRAGHHCAMPLVRSRLMVPATARASFYLYNTEAEVDVLIDGLNQVLRYFGDAASKRA
ncbi:MAG: cysteine desulfurase [Chloroflexi bacterium]|nr:cysteine desulfurase [Chloroflexota bacterium]